jgi:uncharacterized protein YjcR
MPEKWVNLEDIAEHLSVSTDTVRNWIKDGKLPFYQSWANAINSKYPKSMNGYVMEKSRIKCRTQKCGRRENAYAGQDEVPHNKYKIGCCHFSR